MSARSSHAHPLGSGVALLVVLFAMAVGTVLAATYLSAVGLNMAATDGLADSARAGYLAESGVEHGLCLIREQPESLDLLSGFDRGPYDVPNDAGSYSFAVLPSMESSRYWLVGRGIADGRSATKSAVVRVQDEYEALVLSHNPVGYWRMGDTGGSTMTDLALNNHGTIVGDMTLGREGAPVAPNQGAFEFDRDDEIVVIPHHSSYMVDQGSIIVWVRRAGSAPMGVLCKASYYKDSGGHFGLWLSGSRIVFALCSAWQEYTAEVTGIAEDDQWHMIVLTFGHGGMKIYWDGLDRATLDYYGGLGLSSGGPGNYEPIVVGASSYYSNYGSPYPTAYAFEGDIDEVALIPKQLSYEEVDALYKARSSQVDIERWNE